MVESVQWSGSSGGDDTPTESVSFAFGEGRDHTTSSRTRQRRQHRPGRKASWDLTKVSNVVIARSRTPAGHRPDEPDRSARRATGDLRRRPREPIAARRRPAEVGLGPIVLRASRRRVPHERQRALQGRAAAGGHRGPGPGGEGAPRRPRRSGCSSSSCWLSPATSSGARRQIEAVQYKDMDLDAAVAVYRKLLDAEQARRDLFARGVAPGFFGEPPEHLRLRLEAVNRLREGRPAEAAEALAPGQRGHSRPSAAGSMASRSSRSATPMTCSRASSRSWPRAGISGSGSSRCGW